MRKFLLLIVLLSVCACSLGPTIPTEVVTLTQADWEFHYDQAVRRANLWFCGDGFRLPGRQCEAMPENFPSLEVLQARIKSWNEQAAWGQTCTCTHTSQGSYIRIPSDKWDSGCVPHEMLHAALREINHPRWRDIEHGPL